jgi:hypothetical protein
MLRAARKRAASEGKTLDELLLDIAYSKDASLKDILAAIKLFKDKTMTEIGVASSADQPLGPAIFLPAQHPRNKESDFSSVVSLPALRPVVGIKNPS